MFSRPLEIPEVLLITPERFIDERGFLSETYNKRRLLDAGIDVEFVQDNHSVSTTRGVVRGLHFQVPPHAQGKLVRVARGAIFDVAVDIRHGSPTFGKYVSTILSADNWAQLWIPVGFAHGFCTLEAHTEVLYKTTDYYSAECTRGIMWDDPALEISWPVEKAVLSDADRSWPRLSDVFAELEYGWS